jgi:hypothetical protein
MASNVSRGAYYKNKTRKWLEAAGWQVGDLERVAYVGPKRIPVKRDQFASDLLAVSGRRILFVQVKSGAEKGTFQKARRAFAAFTFPPFAGRLVIAWARGASTPRILDMRQEAPK